MKKYFVYYFLGLFLPAAYTMIIPLLKIKPCFYFLIFLFSISIMFSLCTVLASYTSLLSIHFINIILFLNPTTNTTFANSSNHV